MKFVNYKIVFGAIAVIILSIIIKNSTQEILEIKENGSFIADLEKEFKTKQNHNKFLKEQLKYVQTDDFIENEARNRLGLVQNGEVVIQEKFEPSYKKQIKENLEKPNWRQWIDLFM